MSPSPPDPIGDASEIRQLATPYLASPFLHTRHRRHPVFG